MNAHNGWLSARSRLDEGVRAAKQKGGGSNPTYIEDIFFWLSVYGLKQHVREALENVKKAVPLQGDTIEALPQYAYVLVLAGQRQNGLRFFITWRAI